MEDVRGELASGTIHFRMFPSCRLGSRLEDHQDIAAKGGQNTRPDHIVVQNFTPIGCTVADISFPDI